MAYTYVNKWLSIWTCYYVCWCVQRQTYCVCKKSFFRCQFLKKQAGVEVCSGLHNCLLATRFWVRSQCWHFYGKCSGFLPQSKAIHFRSAFHHKVPKIVCRGLKGTQTNPSKIKEETHQAFPELHRSSSEKGAHMKLTGNSKSFFLFSYLRITDIHLLFFFPLRVPSLMLILGAITCVSCSPDGANRVLLTGGWLQAH